MSNKLEKTYTQFDWLLPTEVLHELFANLSFSDWQSSGAHLGRMLSHCLNPAGLLRDFWRKYFKVKSNNKIAASINTQICNNNDKDIKNSEILNLIKTKKCTNWNSTKTKRIKRFTIILIWWLRLIYAVIVLICASGSSELW